MDRYAEEIRKKIEKGELFEGAEVSRDSRNGIERILVVTKEKWVYLVTEKEVKFIGTQGESTVPNLQEGDVEFNFSKTSWTNTDITVEMINHIKEYVLQYSFDKELWSDYTEKVTIEKNVTIYTRLVNEMNEAGGDIQKEVTWIDKTDPTANIQIDAYEIDTTSNITGSLTVSDEASGLQSGLRTLVKGSSPENSSNVGPEYTFNTEEDQNIDFQVEEPGTYFVKLTLIDVAGNECEVFSNPITVTLPPTPEDLKMGDIINYTMPNGAVVPCKVLYDANNASDVEIVAMKCVQGVTIDTAWKDLSAMNNALTNLNNLCASSSYKNSKLMSDARVIRL